MHRFGFGNFIFEGIFTFAFLITGLRNLIFLNYVLLLSYMYTVQLTTGDKLKCLLI